ncbi:MAG: hypothetical protein II919_02850 [Lachnospiraceae bacterium]|nr:hypothetical protein [Lachnospiraceae bacterium]
MTYDEFLNDVREDINKLLGDEVCVKTHRILKNNDIELDALTIITKDSNVSPTIYLNSYYDEYLRGKEIDEITKEICDLYISNSTKINFDVDIFKSFENIRDKVVFKLINTKANKKLLRDIPHIDFLDLSIVFYCMFDNEYLGSATALIHNIHVNMWEITVEELYEIAKENTPKLLKYEIKEMNELIRDILVGDIKKVICENDDRYDKNCETANPEVVADELMKDLMKAKEQISMYVLTNRQRMNGAACLLYDHIIEDFAKEMQKDLYILPSSIHEVILIPAINGMSREELTEMVKEVNKDEVDDIDVLSDHTYYFSREEGKIII